MNISSVLIILKASIILSVSIVLTVSVQVFAQNQKQPVISVTAASVAAKAQAETQAAKPGQAGQPTVQPVTLNKVLFSEGNQSWTSRDQELYQRLLQELTGKDRITPFSDTKMEDFLLSRILKREALLFEIDPKEIKYSTLNKNNLAEFSKREVEQEVTMISLALALLELRDRQMSQKIRFKAWMEVLKKKYSVKMKTDEI